MYLSVREATLSHLHRTTADNMGGLVILVTALVAAVASFADAATLHTREAVKPGLVSCAHATGPIPNPQDCGSFLQCEPSGRIVTRQCPAGLEFNAWRRVCDYPERARCSTGGWRPPPPPPAQDEQTPAEDDSPAVEEPVTPPADAPECPAVENPEEAVQLPNPKDCGSFYKCDASGVAWLNACPAGLEYNARLRVCDYPENAGCSRPGPVEEPAEEPAEEAEEDNAEDEAGEIQQPANPPADAPECPAVENPEEAVQLPNPKDCGSFYKCDAAGVAWLNACPAGLEYNARLRVCDYPENAGCSRPGPVEQPAEEPAEDAAEPAEEENAEAEAGEADQVPSPAADAPKCPAIANPKEAIQLVNPSDCGSFYKCDENGVAWLIPCPAGLHYNAELRVCDYAANAGCSSA
ncbi:chondroitin proteoglycan-2-like [Schistocerca nitens]|uniref:chondroitin proteoglycan-2-like n=1 Tax=Schistocerca nitens TaxID=7011 RepID=UPI002118E216|nr:chondroitin proteoglycan-2-like [Schistocerca nitens]